MRDLRSLILSSCLILVAAVLVTGATYGAEPTDAVYAEAHALLALVDAMDDCDLNCYNGSCLEQDHQTEESGGGNDGGESHSSFCLEGTCSQWHTCGVIDPEGGFALSDVEDLERLLSDLDGEALHRLSLEHDRFAVNWQRGAIQVFGCDDESVMLSIALQPSQRMQLTGLLD